MGKKKFYLLLHEFGTTVRPFSYAVLKHIHHRLAEWASVSNWAGNLQAVIKQLIIGLEHDHGSSVSVLWTPRAEIRIKSIHHLVLMECVWESVAKTDTVQDIRASFNVHFSDNAFPL